MHKVKCPYCNEEFDRDRVEFVKNGRRYIHKICFEKRAAEISAPVVSTLDYSQSAKANLRICCYCGSNVDIKREEFNMVNRRYAHKKCYEENFCQDDIFIPLIYKFLKEEVRMSYDYLQCERQRAIYVTKNGYSNEGILKALKYFYLVLKKSPEQSGNRIGIVPYIYDQAQIYYKQIEQNKKAIGKSINKQLKENPIEIKIDVQEKRKQHQLIDLESIEAENDR